jgi:multidrug resistance protein, MATE family
MTALPADEDHRPHRTQLIALGLPLVLGGLSSTSAAFVDTVMMGHYGAASMAAVSGAAAVFEIFDAVVLASVTGHQILSARFAGLGEPAGIARSLRSSTWFCGGIALALTATCMVGGGWLTGLITAGNAQLKSIGAGYLLAISPTLLLLVPFSLLTAVFSAHKKIRPVLIATIAVNIVNLVLDLVLIFGFGGLPRLGAVGNGLATSIAWATGTAILAVVAWRSDIPELQWRRPDHAPAPPDFVTSIPRLSIPAILSMALDHISLAVFFAIIGGIGAIELAGARIAWDLILLLFGVGIAFSAAERILIGRALGSDHPEAIAELWRTAIRVTIAPALIIAFPLLFFPTAIAGLCTSFHAIQGASTTAIRLTGICVPLMAWTLANISVLRAFGKTSWDMYGNLVSAICLQLPLAWLLGDVAHLGLTGCYLAVVSYWLARAVLTEVLGRKLVAERLIAVPMAGLSSSLTAGGLGSHP